ncbi:hypothetical protein N431DRAFT_466789 [Stipitochalara longipes BDJ]|nr:hypothetical protein N431DRAFT_466789 [Stipitochalara longipes BDJ]
MASVADNEVIPSMPDWLNPGSTGPGSQIPDTPTCMRISSEGQCGWSWQNVQDCTVYRCNHHVIGICSSHGYQIDRNCVCKGLSTSICLAACSTPVSNREYMNWLYATCIGYSGWSNPGTASVDTLSIGSITSQYDAGGTNTENSHDIDATYQIPKCVDQTNSCQSSYAAAWTNCIVNSSEIYLAENGYTDDFYSEKFDSLVSLDRNCACGSVYNNRCSGMCESNANFAYTLYNTWLNRTCTGASAFSGMPPNWEANLLIIDGSNYFPLSSAPVPTYLSCMDSTCRQTLNESMSKSTTVCCELDQTKGECTSTPPCISMSTFCNTVQYGETCSDDCQQLSEQGDLMQWMSSMCSRFNGWNGNFPFIDNVTYYALHQAPIAAYPNCTVGTGCSQAVNQTLYEQNITTRCQSASSCPQPTEAVDWPDFCNTIQYGQTCSNSCNDWWERGDLATWMSSTCSRVDQWTGLPANWSYLFHPLRKDLVPWHWNVSWSPVVEESATEVLKPPHCPSTGAKLGAFAAVNAAMAIIMPVLGRRSVIFIVTFGLLGKPDSNLWWLSGILTVSLHILSNAINAILIQRTAGFASVDVGQLVLLWCTRPRLAWMVMLYLMPREADKTMYTGATASTLFAEIILQLVSAYFMGFAVNYARHQRFFKKGVLSQAPGGHDAITMYAGALMWLACFVFAIAACSWTVFGVNDYLLQLGERLGGLSVKARKHLEDCRTLLSRNSFAADSLGNLDKNLRVLCRYPFQNPDNLRDAVTEFARRESGIWDKQVWDHDTIYYENGRSSAHSRDSGENPGLQPLSPKLSTFRDNAQVGYDAARAARAAEATSLDGFYRDLTQAKSQLRDLEEQNLSTMTSRLRHPIRAVQKVFTTVQPSAYADGGSLERRIANQKRDIEAILRKCEASSSRCAGWDATSSEWAWALRKWDGLIEEREKEGSRVNPETRRLRTLTKWTFLGMIGCWVAQWVWWVGYIRVMGDAYCPPNLPAIAAIWTLFSATGAATGASV